jgi:hypothetical protein
VRAFKRSLRHARLTKLLEWLDAPAIRRSHRIDFVIAPFDGPNRLIVKDEFSIEGFKIHDTSGYAFSMIHRDEYRIAEAIGSFDRVFDQARKGGSTKKKVIEDIRALRDSFAPKSRGGRSATRRSPAKKQVVR